MASGEITVSLGQFVAFWAKSRPKPLSSEQKSLAYQLAHLIDETVPESRAKGRSQASLTRRWAPP
jgi:hypothetical protein